MTLEDFTQSIELDSDPPSAINRELKALWFAKKGLWDESHEIAQDIPTQMGSWIHALLHTIEGDLGNASYWYNRAGKQPIKMEQIDSEWDRIVKVLLLNG